MSFLQINFLLDLEKIKISGIDVWAQRLSYVGELGFELYVSSDNAKALFKNY